MRPIYGSENVLIQNMTYNLPINKIPENVIKVQTENKIV
jgi:hypothetical protein